MEGDKGCKDFPWLVHARVHHNHVHHDRQIHHNCQIFLNRHGLLLLRWSEVSYSWNSNHLFLL